MDYQAFRPSIQNIAFILQNTKYFMDYFYDIQAVV